VRLCGNLFDFGGLRIVGKREEKIGSGSGRRGEGSGGKRVARGEGGNENS